MITITDDARAWLLDLLSMSDQKAILLSVSNKGCGGHSYQMAFTDERSGEVVAIDEDHCVVIDPNSAKLLLDVRIDFVDDGLDRQFVFDNPLETGRCGCQASFTTKPCA